MKVISKCCDMCNSEFSAEYVKASIYVTKDITKKSAWTHEVTFFECIDCWICGCQVILKVRSGDARK